MIYLPKEQQIPRENISLVFLVRGSFKPTYLTIEEVF